MEFSNSSFACWPIEVTLFYGRVKGHMRKLELEHLKSQKMRKMNTSVFLSFMMLDTAHSVQAFHHFWVKTEIDVNLVARSYDREGIAYVIFQLFINTSVGF